MPEQQSQGFEFDVDGFLARPLMAHLATGSEEGARESPLWFLWEGGAMWFIGTSRDSFPPPHLTRHPVSGNRALTGRP